ncbi:PD-(D/E)XK nuclease domain-containing protein [Candidatus Dependentiae bacterium]
MIKNRFMKTLFILIVLIFTNSFNVKAMKRPANNNISSPANKRHKPYPKTPTKQTISTKKSFQSPGEMKISIENLCRKVLGANNDKNEIRIDTKKAIVDLILFFKSLPTDSFSAYFKNCSDKDKALFRKDLTLSLFYMIFLSILQCDKEDTDKEFEKFIPANNGLTFDENKNTVELNFKGHKFTFKYNQNSSDDEKRYLNIIKCNQNNSQSLNYNSNNYIKKTIISLLNIKNYTKNKESNDELDENLSTKFTYILKKLPDDLIKNYEKFFHTIVASILLFMGSNLSFSEMYAGDGRADLIYKSTYGDGIIEFKLNKKDNSKGLEQIHLQKYFKHFCNHSKPIKLISFTFHATNEAFTRVEIKIEKFNIPNVKLTKIKDGYSASF